MREINYIAVHCSATKPSMDVPVERIDKWHKRRGWSGIGYHYYIRRNGAIFLGRDLKTPGAHVRGFNNESIGICYEGGIDEQGKAEDNRTKEQKQALKNLLIVLKQRFPQAVIKGHRDFPNVSKSCPCFDAELEYSDI
jgi:N-acetyl-anhydromuramyl-L-alanine amidase AmpD